jgi:glutaredoxin
MTPPATVRRFAWAVGTALALSAPGAAWAQYKVVTPDGRVTYTDRPPVDAAAKVTPLGKATTLPVAGPANPLPTELQRLAERFPVVLFTAENCAACESGRQALRQRGIPYTERLIVSNDDVAALERTTGGRTVPTLTVGGQALRGFAASDWTSYLDAAGYPRESRLPRGWAPPAPTPLVARAAPPAATAPGIAPAATSDTATDGTESAGTAPAVAEPAPGGNGIRF